MKRPPHPRSASSTTHVSDSEPEREAQRRRLHSPSPPPARKTRKPLTAVENSIQEQLWRTEKAQRICAEGRGKRKLTERVLALENRVEELENALP